MKSLFDMFKTAFASQHNGIVKAILAEPDFDLDAAFLMAVADQRNDLATYLHQQGAEITAVDDKKRNALHLVMHEYHTPEHLVRYLIENGVAIDAQDVDGTTPLMQCSRKHDKDSKVFKLLLDMGADPGIVDNDGNAIIHMTAGPGNMFIVAQLLARNVQLNLPNRKGETPLMLAATKFSFHEDCMEALLAAGANPNCFNADGVTPLMQAGNACKLGSVKLLMAKGADVRAIDHNGQTALAHAIGSHEFSGNRRDRDEIVMILREALTGLPPEPLKAAA